MVDPQSCESSYVTTLYAAPPTPRCVRAAVLPEHASGDDVLPPQNAASSDGEAALLSKIDDMLLQHHTRIAQDFEKLASRLWPENLHGTFESSLPLLSRGHTFVGRAASHWCPSYVPAEARSMRSTFVPDADPTARLERLESVDLRAAAEARSKLSEVRREREEESRYVTSLHKRLSLSVTGRFKEGAQRVISNWAFDLFIAFIIVSNSLLIGVEIEFNATRPFDDIPLAYRWTQHVFALIYLAELVTRIIAEGPMNYFCGWKDCVWHYFDLVLVVSAMIELVIEIIGSVVGALGGIVSMRVMRVMRITRLIRVVRVARLAEVLHAFRILVMQIIGTMQSLGWACLLLTIIIYVFGIFFTRATIDVIVDHGPDPSGAEVQLEIEKLRRFWGGLWISMFSLMQSITGGISWDEVVRPLFAIGTFYVCLFTAFVLFAYLAVLNVITGVFCESAIASAMTDKEMAVHAVLADREDFSKRIHEFFKAVDTDDSGSITLREFEDALDSSVFRAHLESMQISPNDVWSFFQLLDDNRDNEIDIAEFVTGCMRMRGPAKAVDLAKVTYDNTRILKRLEALQQSRLVMRTDVEPETWTTTPWRLGTVPLG